MNKLSRITVLASKMLQFLVCNTVRFGLQKIRFELKNEKESVNR